MPTTSTKVPVLVGVTEFVFDTNITADWQSAGNVVAYSTASTRATLSNNGRYAQADIEFRIDSGPWVPVGINQSVSIDIDFSAQTMRLRRAKWSIPTVWVSLTVQGLPGDTLYAGTADNDPVSAGGVGSPSPSPSPGAGIAITDVPIFVGPTAPSTHPSRYLWIQTGMNGGHDMTFWVEDGI